RIDRVNFITVGDAQAALVNFMSGQIDVVYKALAFEGARTIQQDWAGKNAGTIEMQANAARFFFVQHRPEYASPTDLLDVRVRKALMYAMDRNELAETAASGAARVVNSTTYPESELGRIVEARAVHYDYDPGRAVALFAEAGWQRGPDGILVKGDQ